MRGELSLHRLVKRYKDQTAVDGISLDVAAGEFVTLLGPSGSGKTTTLSMIAGFTTPDSGTIALDGEDVTGLPPHRRDIGMVFQNYALFPHMTAEENVAFPLAMRKVPKKDLARRVREALERVQLADYGARYPRQLSGGQQQRVALARAFVFGPRLLLMDEPLGALDKKLREHLELQMVELCRTLAMTAVYVTHDQEEALVMSDRIVIINGGRVEQAGEARLLYERPTSRFVAEFLGESNIFEGRLSPDRTSVVLPGGHCVPVATQDDATTSRDCAIVVRPEHVLVTLDADPGAHPARLRGRLREIIYLGSDLKLLVEMPDGGTAAARVRPQAMAHMPTPGEELLVSWDPAVAVVVPTSNDVPLVGEAAAGLEATDVGRAA
jgi:putative spermidine/putrescine transport system ATP-binding protein